MATKGNTTRAAIYTWKSSLDERAGDNRSTTAQERECRALAERLGFEVVEVVEVYVEAIGTSASHLTNDARPEFARAMADMGIRYDVLIAWALDRVTRKGIDEMAGLFHRTVGLSRPSWLRVRSTRHRGSNQPAVCCRYPAAVPSVQRSVGPSWVNGDMTNFVADWI